MKRILMVAALACLALALCGLAYADPDDHACAHVFVNVVPNISIDPVSSTVDLGTIQTGCFGSGITFRIDANTEQVKFSAGVSNLYKGDVPLNPTVPPIPIKDNGVCMRAEAASPTGGHSDRAIYVGGEINLLNSGYYGRQTEWVTFESSQNNDFSQSFTVTPTWTQTEDEKPMGEYSGIVVLWSMVVPTTR